LLKDKTPIRHLKDKRGWLLRGEAKMTGRLPTSAGTDNERKKSLRRMVFLLRYTQEGGRSKENLSGKKKGSLGAR